MVANVANAYLLGEKSLAWQLLLLIALAFGVGELSVRVVLIARWTRFAVLQDHRTMLLHLGRFFDLGSWTFRE